MMIDERLLKTVMLGMAEDDRPRGRRARIQSDDVTEWCGCTLPEAVKMALDRKTWRRITFDLTGAYGSRVCINE